jgi:predicted neutral ceramidase superfamily lipid hydrolase
MIFADAAKRFFQVYFFKICLAVTVIFSLIAFSALLAFVFIFYYHVDPVLPLILVASLWLIMIGISYGYCYFAKRKAEAEMARISSLYHRINIFLTMAEVVKRLFKRKK